MPQSDVTCCAHDVTHGRHTRLGEALLQDVRAVSGARHEPVEGGLDLPAGKAVELKPGGYHVMLMDLKAPLGADSTVPLTLTFKDAKGVESKLELKVPVSAKAPAAAMNEHKH